MRTLIQTIQNHFRSLTSHRTRRLKFFDGTNVQNVGTFGSVLTFLGTTNGNVLLIADDQIAGLSIWKSDGFMVLKRQLFITVSSIKRRSDQVCKFQNGMAVISPLLQVLSFQASQFHRHYRQMGTGSSYLQVSTLNSLKRSHIATVLQMIP